MVTIKYHSEQGEGTSLECYRTEENHIAICITDDSDFDKSKEYQNVYLDIDSAVKLHKHLKREIALAKGRAENV